jgi:hypothetical protein
MAASSLLRLAYIVRLLVHFRRLKRWHTHCSGSKEDYATGGLPIVVLEMIRTPARSLLKLAALVGSQRRTPHPILGRSLLEFAL